MTTSNSESRHAAADPECCRQMEAKYGWRLLRIESAKGKDNILKVICVFEGETEFPRYQKED